ncbi:MAG: L7Ae/L30e/S12e/Gadd45 family ribosomal protein [Clostridia bacterium]|nr:L7Ae/L30e/S12e/Gadd45 family ribosomal protein [Clostridia bacterium]
MIRLTEKILSMTGLAVRAGKVRFGVYLTLSACDAGRAKLVIIPSDLGGSNRRGIEAKCKNASIPLITVADKRSLGKACGREETAAVCICDENFKSAILKIYGGGVND